MSSKKVSVTLTYATPGAQPPIFLAGSFSEPAWQPQEMESKTDENGGLHFHKEIQVDEGGEFQYKFRIGLGDWWALNEQAPTVTDELGNKNNLLVVPAAEQIVQKSKASEPATAPAVSDTTIPEVVVEKVDEEPRHGDDFGPNATTGQKDAHDMRALDAEPDHVVIRSQTTTPMYAKTAAEVADSAAMLDREPSPAPVSDEEAGLTGERRMSGTPIPQVALTAAEVADTAAILDQDDDDSYDNLRMSLPEIHYQDDTPSGPGTPWYEHAPLFAHELVGSHDEEVESPITSESLESPTELKPEEEVIDMNDPTLERFPEDRMSILIHIRSCESRMSEDETNIHGVPPSPITRAKSRSSSIDMPDSTKLDAQPSPALDVIAEEHQEEDSYFGSLSGFSQKLHGTEDSRLSKELNLGPHTEEATDDAKSILDKLEKIESATTESENTTVQKELVEPEADENMPLEGTSIAKDQAVIEVTNEQLKENAEIKESLDPDAVGNADESQPEPNGITIQTEPGEKGVRGDQQVGPQEVSPPEQASDTSVHVSDSLEQVRDQAEQNDKEVSREVSLSQSQDGFMPEVQEESVKDLDKGEEVNEGQAGVEKRHEFQNGKIVPAEHEYQWNLAAITHNNLVQSSGPRSLHSAGEVPEDEDPDDKLDADVQAHLNVAVVKHDGHVQSVKTEQFVHTLQDTAEPAQISESGESEQSQLDHANDISMEGAIMKDGPAESTIEVPDAAQTSTAQVSTTEDDVLETDAHQSAIALENTHTELENTRGTDLAVLQKKDEVQLITEHDMLGSESQVKTASREVDNSAIRENPQQEVIETTHEPDIHISQSTTDDEAPLTPEHDVLGSETQESAITVGHHSTDVEPTDEADVPVSQLKVDEPVSEMPVQQVLDAEVDKSATAEIPQPEAENARGPDVLVSQLKVDEIAAVHMKSATANNTEVKEVESTLTNGVDSGKSTSVDAPSPNGLDNESKLSPSKAAIPNVDRPPTPSSSRSPWKAAEPEIFKKSIWRTIFGEWLGGVIANLCGGDRGP